ncbi:lipoprotein NlpI [Ferrimonas pelagia]|uniref:Lipoprotein NlpI n=1 Tax=Ferrimonas pelagia TaxID=1177826 RepID=A0ABP9EDE5_9GAMM
MKKLLAPALIAGLLLGGCATQPSSVGYEPQLLLATPRQADPQVEIQLAKLSELLQVPDLTEQQRARFLYDRGIRYDAVGLRTLARIDFNQALSLQPDYTDVYNFIGIYATQAMEFDQAYQAFDAVLELDPEFTFAYLNRGIALYYGERADLAVQDLTTFLLEEPSDPYRAIWLYLAQQELDSEQALIQLADHRTRMDEDNWATGLVDLFLGRIGAGDLLASSREGLSQQGELAERLCEAYFYLGKRARLQGDNGKAMNLYKLALATNVYEFVEHRYALMEMRQVAESAMAEAEARTRDRAPTF